MSAAPVATVAKAYTVGVTMDPAIRTTAAEVDAIVMSLQDVLKRIERQVLFVWAVETQQPADTILRFAREVSFASLVPPLPRPSLSQLPLDTFRQLLHDPAVTLPPDLALDVALCPSLLALVLNDARFPVRGATLSALVAKFHTPTFLYTEAATVALNAGINLCVDDHALLRLAITTQSDAGRAFINRYAAVRNGPCRRCIPRDTVMQMAASNGGTIIFSPAAFPWVSGCSCLMGSIRSEMDWARIVLCGRNKGAKLADLECWTVPGTHTAKAPFRQHALIVTLLSYISQSAEVTPSMKHALAGLVPPPTAATVNHILSLLQTPDRVEQLLAMLRCPTLLDNVDGGCMVQHAVRMRSNAAMPLNTRLLLLCDMSFARRQAAVAAFVDRWGYPGAPAF